MTDHHHDPKKDDHGSHDNKGEIDLKKKLEEAQKQAAHKHEEEKSSNVELEKLKAELAEMTEVARRAMADLQNLRRRNEEERLDIILMANSELIKNLLPVIENLDRAVSHIPEGASEWYKGIEMSIKELHKVLLNLGLTKIETVGAKFDPNLHEALTQGPGEKDIVIEEFESGYILGKKVIKHAKVSVGNGE